MPMEAQTDAQENLSQQAANPLADLISLPFQNNLNINHGEFSRNVNVQSMPIRVYSSLPKDNCIKLCSVYNNRL